VDLQGFFANVNRVDLLIFLFFMAFFVLGFAQGTIRRLIGIASILFSFLFAANVAEPLGNYLGSNWTQFSKEYATMIGFMTVFLASSVAFAVVVQGLYKTQPLFQKARFLDELVGGILGLLEAALIFGCILVILDSFFRIPGIVPDAQELRFLRQFWEQIDPTRAAAMFRDTVIPTFFLLTGFLVPDWIERNYPR
jgi:membrane protein required for colicin V production